MQDALEAASGDTEAENIVIHVAPGTYTVGFADIIYVQPRATCRSFSIIGASTPTITGAGWSHVLAADLHPNCEFTISGFRVDGRSADPRCIPDFCAGNTQFAEWKKALLDDRRGGNFLILGGLTVTIEGCSFINTTSATSGGHVYIGPSRNPEWDHATLHDAYPRGAATTPAVRVIGGSQGFDTGSSLFLCGTTSRPMCTTAASTNVYRDTRGGSLCIEARGPVEIVGCDFLSKPGAEHAGAEHGGAVFVQAPGQSVTVRDCGFHGNGALGSIQPEQSSGTWLEGGLWAGYGTGGAMHVESLKLTIEYCRFVRNGVFGGYFRRGGALFFSPACPPGNTECVQEGSSLRILNSAFCSNLCSNSGVAVNDPTRIIAQGGAIYAEANEIDIVEDYGGRSFMPLGVEVRRSVCGLDPPATFASNRAGAGWENLPVTHGGAAYLIVWKRLRILGARFYQNQASEAGDLYLTRGIAPDLNKPGSWVDIRDCHFDNSFSNWGTIGVVQVDATRVTPSDQSGETDIRFTQCLWTQSHLVLPSEDGCVPSGSPHAGFIRAACLNISTAGESEGVPTIITNCSFVLRNQFGSSCPDGFGPPIRALVAGRQLRVYNTAMLRNHDPACGLFDYDIAGAGPLSVFEHCAFELVDPIRSGDPNFTPVLVNSLVPYAPLCCLNEDVVGCLPSSSGLLEYNVPAELYVIRTGSVVPIRTPYPSCVESLRRGLIHRGDGSAWADVPAFTDPGDWSAILSYWGAGHNRDITRCNRQFGCIDIGAIEYEPADSAVMVILDMNDDALIDADDLGDYINLYFSTPQSCLSDFNYDGSVDADDLGDYINAYFSYSSGPGIGHCPNLRTSCDFEGAVQYFPGNPEPDHHHLMPRRMSGTQDCLTASSFLGVCIVDNSCFITSLGDCSAVADDGHFSWTPCEPDVKCGCGP